jgi:WbqC-like protein family
MPSVNKKPAVLLSTAYLAPVQYYTKLISYEHIYIEYFENYSKQSYRNRCTIQSTNGSLDLSIPVTKESVLKVFTKDVKIDNNSRWKQMHIRALESAYRSSPYFLYYADDLLALYEKNYTFLVDLNNDFQKTILKFMNVEVDIQFTSNYKELPFSFDDFSDSIHPKIRMKKPDNDFYPKNYYQVFETRFGFVTNLCIADLLFNMGPNSLEILKTSIKT